VRACVRACVRVCVCVCVSLLLLFLPLVIFFLSFAFYMICMINDIIAVTVLHLNLLIYYVI